MARDVIFNEDSSKQSCPIPHTPDSAAETDGTSDGHREGGDEPSNERAAESVDSFDDTPSENICEEQTVQGEGPRRSSRRKTAGEMGR